MIRFFNSFLCEWIIVSYLYKHKHYRICDYLYNHMYTLPLTQITTIIDRDILEIDCMVDRIARHFDLETLPQFDGVQSLERGIGSCPPQTKIPNMEIDELIG